MLGYCHFTESHKDGERKGGDLHGAAGPARQRLQSPSRSIPRVQGAGSFDAYNDATDHIIISVKTLECQNGKSEMSALPQQPAEERWQGRPLAVLATQPYLGVQLAQLMLSVFYSQRK